MSEESKTQVIIATLGVVGVLGSAVFANWDNCLYRSLGTIDATNSQAIHHE